MPYTIALPALMGHIRDSESYFRGCAYLRARGHTLVEDANALAKHGYFSAPDDVRLAAFHAMLWQKPDIVMPIRAGYGITRLLPNFDWSLIRTCGAKFVGFSDFTGFSLAAIKHGVMTFAGPMVCSDFGRETIDPYTEEAFWRTIESGRAKVDVAAYVDDAPQVIDGTLWGTNLSLISHLIGTPYFPLVRNGILLIEEIAEEPYAVERMLMQLWHAGVLQEQRALIIGAVNGFDLNSPSAASYLMDEVIADLRTRVRCPIVTDFPFGHVAKKATLPIGGPARLTLRAGGYTLEAQV